MQRDYETRLEVAALAAADGATPEQILEETELELSDIRNVIRFEVEARKRREARRGLL